MEAAADLAAAIAELRQVSPRFHTCTDEEVVADADAEAVEALGRMVDGLRLQVAAQVEHRSRKVLGEQSLAFRRGARDGVQLVEHLTGTSRRTARSRVGLGAALAPTVSLLGDVLPGRYQVLADAMAAGEIGVEAARLIVDRAQSMRRFDQLHEAAERLAGHLDPDGSYRDPQQCHRKRALRVGRTLADGTTSLSIVLLPEHLAVLKELLQSRRRSRPLIRTTPGGDDTVEETDPEYREEEAPDGGGGRPRAQQDYDTLFETLVAGIRAEADGAQSHAVTHEVVVTITAEEVEARHGRGFTAGSWPASRCPRSNAPPAPPGSGCWLSGTTGSRSTSPAGTASSPQRRRRP